MTALAIVVVANVIVNWWAFRQAKRGRWLMPQDVGAILKTCRDVETEHGLPYGSVKMRWPE